MDEEAKDDLVEGEDFYREGPYIVFTEKYLLKRGCCCESGCRHCPYGYEKKGARCDVTPSVSEGPGGAVARHPCHQAPR